MKLLRNYDFSLIWIGQTFSQFGDSLYDIAIIWLTLTLTNSAQSIGLILFARAAPYFVFGLFAGAYSDRWNRRLTMIWSDVLRTIIVLAIPILYLTHQLAFWHLIVVAFTLTSVRTFFNPSLQASIPQVVAEEDLGSANAMLHAALQTTTIVGPVVAGFLLVIVPAYQLFLLDSVTFLISAVSLFALRSLRKQETRSDSRHPRVVRDIATTAIALRDYRLAFWGIVLFGLGLIMSDGLLRVALPLFTTNILHGQSSTYGLIMGVVGIGTVGGALLILRRKIKNYGLYLFLGWIFWGVFQGLLGITGVLPFILVCALLLGSAQALADVSMTTLLQSALPQAQLGKVFSFWSTWANIGDALSGLLFGWLIGPLPLVTVFVIGGGVTTIIGLFGLFQVWRDSQRIPIIPSSGNFSLGQDLQ